MWPKQQTFQLRNAQRFGALLTAEPVYSDAGVKGRKRILTQFDLTELRVVLGYFKRARGELEVEGAGLGSAASCCLPHEHSLTHLLNFQTPGDLR